MNSSATPLADLAARYWHFLCYEMPLTAIQAGEPVSDSVLFRESETDHSRRRRKAEAFLTELKGIDLISLHAQDRATHQLLRFEIENILSFYALAAHHRPSLFPNGPALLTSHFANISSIADNDSAQRFVDRLATVPAYLNDLRESLQAGYEEGHRYPKLVLDCAAGSIRAALAGPVEALPWAAPFKRSVVSGRDSIRRSHERTLALMRNELLPAFEAFVGFLQGPLAVGARDSVACSEAPLGQQLYSALVRSFTTTDLQPPAIHKLGLEEVDRLEDEMAAVAANAGYHGDLAGYRQFLASDAFIAPSKDVLREQIEILSKRIDKCIPAFFGRIPRITYGVESWTETVAERMPPAYAQVNPADGTAPGIYWITSLPGRFPNYLHLPFTLHEAWPGHLMHIALMQELENLPAFRRYGGTRYTACIEGWALYCESLGVDMGLYQAPHQHYGRLEGEIWRAIRLVVDTGIHWQGWDRERAIAYMMRYLAQPRATVEAEVDRYICWPGQALAYQIGNLKFRDLRRRAELRLADRFNIRTFHDTLTSAGGVTLPVLDGLMEEWMNCQTQTKIK